MTMTLGQISHAKADQIPTLLAALCPDGVPDRAAAKTAAQAALVIWEQIYPDDARPRRAVEALDLSGFRAALVAWPLVLGVSQAVVDAVTAHDFAAQSAARGIAHAAMGRFFELMDEVPHDVRHNLDRPRRPVLEKYWAEQKHLKGLTPDEQGFIQAGTNWSLRPLFPANGYGATSLLSDAALNYALWRHYDRPTDTVAASLAYVEAVSCATTAARQFAKGEGVVLPPALGLKLRLPLSVARLHPRGINAGYRIDRDTERAFTRAHGRAATEDEPVENWLIAGVLPDDRWVKMAERLLPEQTDPRYLGCVAAAGRWLAREAARWLSDLEASAKRELPEERALLAQLTAFLDLDQSEQAEAALADRLTIDWESRKFAMPLNAKLGLDALKRLWSMCRGLQAAARGEKVHGDPLDHAEEYESYALWQPLVVADEERESKRQMFRDLDAVLHPSPVTAP